MILLGIRLRWPELGRAGFLALGVLSLAACGGEGDEPDETSAPQFILQWGSRGQLDGQFDNPVAVDVDGDGNVYVTDPSNRRIQKFRSDGQFLAKWSPRPHLGAPDADFPYRIAVEPSGNVFVSYYDGHRIEKYTRDGQFLVEWGSSGRRDGQFNHPLGIDVDAAGNVYVADTENARIQKFTNDGQFLKTWGSQGPGAGQFSRGPWDVSVHPNGNVYVTDWETLGREMGPRAPMVQVFTAEGAFVTRFGSGEDLPDRFSTYGLGFDGDGRVYVTYALGANRVQRFTSDGTYLTGWGSSGTTPGQFQGPTDVAVDGSGNVYVVDARNYRIQKFR